MVKFSKRKSKFRLPDFILILLLLFSSISLGLSSGKFIVNLKTVGFTIVSTMQIGVHKITDCFTNTAKSIKERRQLHKEYKVLLEKVQDYEYLERNNAEIKKENERLREQLDYMASSEYKSYSARIIGRETDNLYSGITIDKGARNGIKKGMSVIAIQNGDIGLVGKIVTVGPLTSLIMPIYDMQCHISARIQNTRDIGIVQGNGTFDSNLSMSYIRKRALEDFNYGDLVVTSGENANYPADIAIGSISKITVLDYDTSLDIEVEPMIDFNRLEYVLVMDLKSENDIDIEAFDASLSEEEKKLSNEENPLENPSTENQNEESRVVAENEGLTE